MAHVVIGTSFIPEHRPSNDDEESYFLKMIFLVTVKTWTVRNSYVAVPQIPMATQEGKLG